MRTRPEPAPASSPIRHFLTARRVVLKEHRVFAVSAPNGTMQRESPDGHGVWVGDTRILSDYVLSFDGQQMVKRDLEVHPGWAAFEGTAGSLSIRQERYVEEGLNDRITLTNAGSARIDVQLRLDFGADFAAMLAVRGIVQLPPPRPTTLTPTDRGGSLGTTNVVVTPAGREQRLRLDPGERKSIVVDVLPAQGAAVGDFEPGLSRVKKDYERWSADCALSRPTTRPSTSSSSKAAPTCACCSTATQPASTRPAACPGSRCRSAEMR